MGMRQNIELTYMDGNKIYFYSHWDGGEMGDSPLENKLKDVLGKKLRWDDESYLARMIFSKMIADDIEGETGYGIAPYIVDDEFPTIKVNLKEKTVNGERYEDFINS